MFPVPRGTSGRARALASELARPRHFEILSDQGFGTSIAQADPLQHDEEAAASFKMVSGKAMQDPLQRDAVVSQLKKSRRAYQMLCGKAWKAKENVTEKVKSGAARLQEQVQHKCLRKGYRFISTPRPSQLAFVGRRTGPACLQTVHSWM